jgi:integrase
MPGGDKLDALLYTMPVRVRKTDQGRWEGDGDGKPFDCTTVSRDWHKAALQDADLRDMPLHALRHTAAAAWLAGGNSLKYVQDQVDTTDALTFARDLPRRGLSNGVARISSSSCAREPDGHAHGPPKQRLERPEGQLTSRA